MNFLCVTAPTDNEQLPSRVSQTLMGRHANEAKKKRNFPGYNTNLLKLTSLVFEFVHFAEFTH